MSSSTTGSSPGRWAALGKDTKTFLSATAPTPVVATNGGFVELLVKLNDKVEAGQTVAVQRNSFGEVVAEYTSGVTGEVGACRTDATSEPGNMLVTVLYNRAPPDPIDPIPE